MYSNLNDFLSAYAFEHGTTVKVLGALSNDKLGHEKAPGDTPIGELAWHIASAPAYMINHEGAGIEFEYQPPADATVDSFVAECNRVYDATVAACNEKLAARDLTQPANWFGFELPLGVWLNMIVNHEVHHRGQLTAMMRNAGLKVPGCYGPNKEDFEQMMAQKAAEAAA
jgi:uncharacterized damage-inducible protein DinB